MIVNGKELKKALKDATIFCGEEKEVWLWSEGDKLAIFTNNGHTAYKTMLENHETDTALEPVAITTGGIKSLSPVIDVRGLVDLNISDNSIMVNGNGKAEITISQKSNHGREAYEFITKRLSENINYTIPENGIKIPAECFSKSLSVFKGMSLTPKMQCLTSKGSLEKGYRDDICFFFTCENVSIWCMGMRQSEN